jgi:hypothetical protein
MLQNAVADVSKLGTVKQLGDQVVARGGQVLDFEAYLELLPSACSTYDKNHNSPKKSGKRKVYAASTTTPDDVYYDADDGYHDFGVDTNVTDFLAYTTNMRYKGSALSKEKSHFIPRDEWLKLSQEKREEKIGERYTPCQCPSS